MISSRGIWTPHANTALITIQPVAYQKGQRRVKRLIADHERL